MDKLHQDVLDEEELTSEEIEIVVNFLVEFLHEISDLDEEENSEFTHEGETCEGEICEDEFCEICEEDEYFLDFEIK